MNQVNTYIIFSKLKMITSFGDYICNGRVTINKAIKKAVF